MTSMLLDVSTPQGFTLVPEVFQQGLIEGMTAKLLQTQPPPCLLRAPTGSGKTFMLTKVLGNVSNEQSVVWLWFVPFVNLVNQTLDAVISNAGDLSPVLFSNGLNQDPAAGQVLISTTQGVSRAAWRKLNYHANGGEQERTAAEFVALARANNLQLGVVVDEAHIALDHATEFGKFVAWLNPQYLMLATATPKSDRITQFLASAQMSSFESFNVSREDVVKARLNKAYIEAVVYDLRESTATVADLKRTVLRQAWLRNKAIKLALSNAGIPLSPLLLVQVENGPDAIDQAERDLIELCKIPPQAIGKHSADKPDPQLMDAIANDTTKEVLIFKQSAGTGFDAPRAFVLASTKTVNDSDFAMQFIGRVMRVSRQVRASYTHYKDIPAELNTAYVYLANAAAQQGFQQAVQLTDAVQTQLEGQVEKMSVRTTRSGATTYTNQPTSQPPLTPRLPLPQGTVRQPQDQESDVNRPGPEPTGGETSSLFLDGELDELDELAPIEQKEARPRPESAASRDEWEGTMKARGITLYPLRQDMQSVPNALKRERRPDALDMEAIVRRIAIRLVLQESHQRNALLAVRGKLQETERRTELTRRTVVDGKVSIIIDRNRIAAEANAAMKRLPQFEEADRRILIELMASRITPRLSEALEDADSMVEDKELRRMARTAACWLIRAHITQIEEALHEEIASQADTLDAAPLPDMMLFPTAVALPPSSKNLYGILPPTKDDLLGLEQSTLLEDRELLQDKQWRMGESGAMVRTGRFDSTFALNPDELRFAQALDRASFVAWWFRNPDKKPYSVRLVRGEHRNFFYPDFVVCLSHVDGADPIQRLVETKHDLKDASRKARHTPEHYGKVLFLTRDGGRYCIVTEEGSVGEPLDLDDLEALREALQRTAP
ncbi:DEAD/DEAH box helicase [Halomonas faecis]|uniref:DEAD/DEAH box helicase n=1 Tax=Halomonas faecis TaxID=1562110 RepID=UPI0013D428F7|nr:DEAD/DEAH box helicase family protein [Halomonas faecis]